jgi:hypothetical protein
MKLNCFLIFFISVIIKIQAQSYKSLETSGKKPGWANGIENNFIITSGIGKTVEEAKEECLKSIRDQIITGVAVNVRSKTEINIQQKNGVSDEKMKFSLVSQSANIPFLNGISLSKAKGFYWEKVQDKKTKIISFGYHVKYPFSNAELASLIEEFDKQNQETSNRINYLIKASDTVSYVESYEKIANELRIIQKDLIDDRKDKIDAALINLAADLKSLQISAILNSPGRYTFTIKNRRKTLKCSQIPNFKSNCGKLTGSNSNDTLFTILYESSLCKYTDNPKASITWNTAGGLISHEFIIDVNANKIELNIDGDILLSKLEESQGMIQKSNIEIPLFSKYAYPFLINKIEMKFENNPPIVLSDIGIKNAAKGINSLKIGSKNSFSKSVYSSANKSFPYVDVTLYVTNINTKEEQIVKLSNIRFSSDW